MADVQYMAFGPSLQDCVYRQAIDPGVLVQLRRSLDWCMARQIIGGGTDLPPPRHQVPCHQVRRIQGSVTATDGNVDAALLEIRQPVIEMQDRLDAWIFLAQPLQRPVQLRQRGVDRRQCQVQLAHGFGLQILQRSLRVQQRLP